VQELLNDRVVLITGAGRGFGAGIARGMARAGARVCITDINEEELAQSAADLKGERREVLPLLADVGDLRQMEDAVAQTVALWGRLDVIVNNAAAMPLVPFRETSGDLWDMIIRVNLTGVFNGVKAAWLQMEKQGGGHCMAIASGASMRGFVNEVAYCAAKHGLAGFTKALAMEAEASNIAMNTVGPGKLIKPTNITRAEAAAMSPEQRAGWVDPIELAPAFIWLALQPPQRFTGMRFDAGPLADTIAAEGYDFDFAPEKATLYVDEFNTRTAQRREWTTLATQ
jgi:NAD(P)-dependent dehydrogenase (short-subunit alcohol dehydrogenase family)